MKTGLLFKIAFFIFCLPFYGVGQVTYTVNTTDDIDDGVCDGVHCSLREAVNKSQVDGLVSNVDFNISGDGPHIIFLKSVLVFSTSHGDTINGLTQPSNDPMNGQIIIDGSGCTSCSSYNVRAAGDNWVIKGLVFNRSVGNFFYFLNGNNWLFEDNVFQNISSKALVFQANNNHLNNNHFINNGEAISVQQTGIKITKNKFSCNYIPININSGGASTPIINTVSNSDISGTASPFDSIHIYIDENSCSNGVTNCQGSNFIIGTKADAAGNWTSTGLSLSSWSKVTAIATNSIGSSSKFANCKLAGFCSNSTLNSAIEGPVILDVNQSYLLEGNPSGGTGIYNLHDWYQIAGNGSVQINNNNDGTSDIIGIGTGNVILRYLVEDSNGCVHASDYQFEIKNFNCISSGISNSIEGPSTLTNNSSVLYNGLPNGGALPYSNHSWTQIDGIGVVNIVNNNDGTAQVSGVLEGNILLSYEVTDANGCTYKSDKWISYAEQSYVVNTTDYVSDGVCDATHCSLLEAINEANSDGVPSAILFNIPGNAPHVINPTNVIVLNSSNGDVIDGSSQPGSYSPNKKNIVIDGCCCTDCTSYHIRGMGDNWSITGIEFRNVPTSLLYTLQSNNLIITKNVFHDIGKWALWFQSRNHYVHENLLYNNGTAVTIQDSEITLTKNRMYCNQVEGISGGRNSAPVITTANNSIISGIANSGDNIEIFLADQDSCQNLNCQGSLFIGSTICGSTGNWELHGDFTFKSFDLVTATATDAIGNTSNFSNCYIILPDECSFGEELPVNENPCSTTGIVIDLKQLTLSQEATQSNCGSTLIGNDAWYQIEVPSTGNLLVRSNINNTVNPVIEAYTGSCGNLSLIDCSEIDSLPKAMTFENYTSGNTIYLRVWDKNNTITDSENTALLHLTAHELPLNKDEWELCDQENNLINGNPTILSERDANSFILEYEPDATPADIAAIELELQNDGSTLTESCLCNGVPLQLWKSGNPIDTEDRRRGMKRRANVDTTNYNYVFETVEFQVNAYAIGEQYATDVAMDSEGDFAMVWTDQQRRHNYGRVYKSSGNPITQEFQLGTSDKTQYSSSIAMEEDGDFVAVWHEINAAQAGATFAVYGRQYNSDGTPKGTSFDISTASANTSSDQDVKDIAGLGANAQVAVDANGNFNVVWNSGAFIYAQRLDNTANLVGNIIEIGTTVNNNVSPNPSIGVNDNGEFIIVWNGQDAEETGIYAQRYNVSGSPIGNAFLVNSVEAGTQSNPDIALANDGSFIIIWESYEQAGAGLDFDVYAQRFDSNGNKVGAEFLVNSYTTDAQRHPSISIFDDGSFVIAWSSKGQDGFEEGIYAKVFDANGTPINPAFDDSDRGSVGEEFRMNTYEEPEQEKPSTATNGSNIIIGAWEDGANDGSFKGIFAQRYEILPDNTHTKIFYPIGTATPSTLLGDQLDFPTTVYTPSNAVKRAKVAIIDTGIDDNHTHLTNALWSNPATNDGENCVLGDVIGYDFVNESGNPIDVDGHGTKVSGIVTRDFDTGVQLELMSLKFHELNRGKVFDAICAIHYAVDNGAEILNLSWGFEASEFPAILNKALKYASDQGVLVITTAGNTSKNNDRINKFPANLDIENMIVVTAYEYRQSDGTKRLANYASYGQSQVDIAAYGFVESPKKGGGLEPSAGTSLAAPLVARTAATIKGLYPVLTAAEIKDCILSSAEQVPAFSNLVASGGILDHDAALICAQDKFDLITTDSCANSGLTATPTIINESCTGMDGVISFSTSGTDPNPTFLWSTADTSSTVNNLMAGNYSVTITDTSRCVIELNLSVGMDCSTGNCQTNLVINDNPIMDSTYLSDNTITSSGIIPSGGTVTFKAEESITLLSGFHATTNSDFLATIEVCPTNSLQTLPQELTIRQANFQNNHLESISAKVYPNPTNSQLNVQVFKVNEGFQLEIFDVMGRKLNSWSVPNNQATLSVEGLSAGLYYLRIDEQVVEKIVVGQK